jgi:hypothetical protein
MRILMFCMIYALVFTMDADAQMDRRYRQQQSYQQWQYEQQRYRQWQYEQQMRIIRRPPPLNVVYMQPPPPPPPGYMIVMEIRYIECRYRRCYFYVRTW